MFETTRHKITSKGISTTSSPLAAREIISQLMVQLRPANLGPDDSSRIELVVAEAVNNIVEHAYPPGAPDGPIQLNVKRRDDTLCILITDQGLGMPDGKAPSGRPQNVKVNVMDLPEGGFGWFLIRDQAQNVEYRRTAWENRLSFEITINGCVD